MKWVKIPVGCLLLIRGDAIAQGPNQAPYGESDKDESQAEDKKASGVSEGGNVTKEHFHDVR